MYAHDTSNVSKPSPIIGIWDRGWDEAPSAEINIGTVLDRIGSVCRSNLCVPKQSRNDFAEDAQTAVLELAFNNIVRNGLPFKNSASLITKVHNRGLLIRTYNLAYYREFRRLSDRIDQVKIGSRRGFSVSEAVILGAKILDQDTCPSFGGGLDLVFAMTRDSEDACPHISARKFSVPNHLRPAVDAFIYPDDIAPTDRVIVGVRLLALIPYHRYAVGTMNTMV